jgi:carbonic anhydrase
MMNRRHALRGLAGLALCPLCVSAGLAAEEARWSYEGATGPDKWGDLDAASRVCSIGTQQSPIDIIGSIPASLPPLRIAWKAEAATTIVNNGHTIQLNAGEGSTLTVGTEKYALLQFHFHRPSEHTIGGKSSPMEVHYVHRNAAGNLAVVGVLMTAGNSNATFKTIAATMPTEAGAQAKAAGIDPNGLLPAARSYYRYAGSLTTPGCGEIVDWLLLTTPVQVAQQDIDAFAKLYPLNARPVQKLNRRFLLKSG